MKLFSHKTQKNKLIIRNKNNRINEIGGKNGKFNLEYDTFQNLAHARNKSRCRQGHGKLHIYEIILNWSRN